MTRIGSLFSGYGGLDIAVQSVLGGDLAWYSEIEPAACKVLAAHHPGVPNLGDITRVDWADVEPVDILTGGYPCQPFSHAGQRKGTNDERHLWPYVRDAIAALRPVVTVLENVDGHRSLGLADVLGDVAALGLSARWVVVRAADAGAPHGRKRVFIVVTDPDQSRRQGADAGLDVGAGRRGADRHAAQGDHVTAADAVSERHHGSGADDATAGPGSRGADAKGLTSPLADPDRDGHGGGQDARGVGSLEAGDEGEPRQRQRARREPGAGGSVASADADNCGRNGRPRNARRGAVGRTAADGAGDSGVNWGKYEPAIRRWEYVLGRLAPDPTVPGASGRPRLSPAFVEWMMGLPAGHVTGHGLRPAQCLKMLGNGVVPQQAALALRLILGEQVTVASSLDRVLPTPTSGDHVGIGYATSEDELTRADGRHRLRDAAAFLGGNR